MLQVLDQVHNKTLLVGHCDWEYNYPPALAVFSGNRSYIAWYTEVALFGRMGEAEYRMHLNNDFYAGKLADPLGFLLDNQIAAVMIAPGDNIPDGILAQLTKQLEPAYRYIDCRIDPAPMRLCRAVTPESLCAVSSYDIELLGKKKTTTRQSGIPSCPRIADT